MLSKLFKTKEERSGLISALLKPVGMVLSLIYTPMLLHYLGSEKYGLWATILSVISWINYFDVGIGNGLRNTVTANIEAGEYAEAKKNVSTAYVILSGVSFVILYFIFLHLCELCPRSRKYALVCSAKARAGFPSELYGTGDQYCRAVCSVKVYGRKSRICGDSLWHVFPDHECGELHTDHA